VVVEVGGVDPRVRAAQRVDDGGRRARVPVVAEPEEAALALAEAVNAELRELKEAGADVLQLDEPWLQARSEAAERYGVKAINRALEGVPGPVAIHLCFGYAAIVHEKPSGYSFLPQLADCTAAQISIEAAQPKLDLGVLRDLAGKTIILGVISLGELSVEEPETVADRIRAAFPYVAPERLIPAPDCGMKYLPADVAFGKVKAMVEGARLLRKEFQ
jgi:5-methyltetrahydropteroyltriglutamate--homocysteine methyltransferase